MAVNLAVNLEIKTLGSFVFWVFALAKQQQNVLECILLYDCINKLTRHSLVNFIEVWAINESFCSTLASQAHP